MHVMTLTVLINLSFSSISIKFPDKLTTVDLVIVVTSMVINFVVAKIFVKLTLCSLTDLEDRCWNIRRSSRGRS